MGWFKFRNSDNSPAPQPTLIAKPYYVKMAESRDALHWLVKKYSNEISTATFSEIREMERTLADINKFIETHPTTATDEHMLDSIMTDFLPSALSLFSQLPAQNKTEGSQGEILLLTQCQTMAKDLKARNTELHERAEQRLRNQAAFIEDRFTGPPA